MTYRSIERLFCGAHPTPGLGALSANLVELQIDARDGLVNFQRLGQCLEAGTDPANKWLSTETYRISSISALKTLHKTTLPFSIYVRQLSSTRDEQ